LPGNRKKKRIGSRNKNNGAAAALRAKWKMEGEREWEREAGKEARFAKDSRANNPVFSFPFLVGTY